LHGDCVYYGTLGGVPFCDVCKEQLIRHYRNAPDEHILQCQKGICYFYEPKENEND
jgi:hypothetical protein